MPVILDPGAGDAIDLAQLIDALGQTRVDVRDEAAFASLGPILARLGRNRDFLGDLAVDALKRRYRGDPAGAAGQVAGGYGPQVMLLMPPDGRYVVRANFWPARSDQVVRSSGTDAFFYDLPHDHNFPFLTYGYLGPGYWSDYYTFDADAVVGLPGEAAGLCFQGRARLEPNQLMLYRMRRDVHAQLPPDEFSVSLNILGVDAEQPWVNQHRFDLRSGRIAALLSTTPSEALLRIAAHLGGNGTDLAADFAGRHPHPRMRAAAIDALAGAADSPDATMRWLATGMTDPHPFAAGMAAAAMARRQADRLNRNGPGSPPRSASPD